MKFVAPILFLIGCSFYPTYDVKFAGTLHDKALYEITCDNRLDCLQYNPRLCNGHWHPVWRSERGHTVIIQCD